MNIYQSICLYFFVSLWAGIGLIVAKKQNKKWLKISTALIAAFPFWFIMAFRYDVGTDYFFTYIPRFVGIFKGQSGYKNEYGFYLINRILAKISTQPQIIIIFTSSLYSIFLIDTILKNSDDPFYSFFIFLFMGFMAVSFNNIRQQLAAVLVLWAIKYVQNRNLAAFIGIIVVAMYFFHLSAIFLIIVYPLFNIKLIRKTCIIWMPLVILCSSYFAKLFLLALELMGYGYGSAPSFQSNEGNYILFFTNYIILVLFILGYRDKIIKDRLIFGFFSLQFVATFIAYLTYYVHMLEIPDRIIYYFMIYQIISIPNLIVYTKNNNKLFYPLIIIFSTAVAIFIFNRTIISWTYHEVLPYQFVFEHLSELKDLISK